MWKFIENVDSWFLLLGGVEDGRWRTQDNSYRVGVWRGLEVTKIF